MGIFAAHIRGLRKNAGLTQEKLAARIDVGVTTIKNIESEYITAPPTALVEKLAGVFGVESYSLLHKNSLDVGERAKMVHIVSSVCSEKPFVEIEKIVQTVFLDRDELRGYEYMGIRMPDNSMIDAHICAGASVIVRQNAPIKNGDVVLVVYNDSDGIVRRYESNGEEVILTAENSSGLYPPIRLSKSKDRVVVLGKVIRWVNTADWE